MPEDVWSQVLQWGHSSKLTCHPGVQRLLQFLHQHFWWPAQSKDVSLWWPVLCKPGARHLIFLTPACTQSSLVPSCRGFCYRSPTLWWKHHYPHHSGLLLQAGSLHSPGQAPIHLQDHRPSHPPCFPWPSFRHCLWSWTPIQISD